EHVLRQTGDLPRYDLLDTTGPENDRRYTVGVFAGERLLARGVGSSIKEAGKEAARAALRGEEIEQPNPLTPFPLTREGGTGDEEVE
ncbi:MAG TPA: putative dsRNA-binding protein, partial [Ktedonobacterales bacterium]|nr:putative dsRNA-binding protein [Ktedonobacterales bacterium]